MPRTAATVVAALAVVAAGVSPAGAGEGRAGIGSSMLLDLTAPRVDGRQAAFDAALKEPAPAPSAPAGELLPDGGVRYGNVTVYVKNPCPPAAHAEPPPLPGRRARN